MVHLNLNKKKFTLYGIILGIGDLDFETVNCTMHGSKNSQYPV